MESSSQDPSITLTGSVVVLESFLAVIRLELIRRLRCLLDMWHPAVSARECWSPTWAEIWMTEGSIVVGIDRVDWTSRSWVMTIDEFHPPAAQGPWLLGSDCAGQLTFHGLHKLFSCLQQTIFAVAQVYKNLNKCPYHLLYLDHGHHHGSAPYYLLH